MLFREKGVSSGGSDDFPNREKCEVRIEEIAA